MGTWRWALLEGISVKHAQIIIEKHGYSIRIIEEDGEGKVITDDHISKRVNVRTKESIIIKVDGLY